MMYVYMYMYIYVCAYHIHTMTVFVYAYSTAYISTYIRAYTIIGMYGFQGRRREFAINV